jgi:opacity protein-like surface antigen
MKLNKWTLGLAAVGIVSMASVVQAEDMPHAVMTALDSTTLSGYVDTSMQWNPGSGNQNNPPYAYSHGKADGFNLNAVMLTLQKPLNENEWASGYRVDIAMGPDAGPDWGLRTGEGASGLSVKQAYVSLRMPVGNGLDWKIGAFDSIIGYESFESGNNPNYTRSWGYTLEPTTHTGILASYRFCDHLSASAGVANTFGPGINQRAFGESGFESRAESYKTYMGSLTLTAPEAWGFLAGSSLYGGVINGANMSGDSHSQTSWYAGMTLASPVTGLKLGAAFDFVDQHRFDNSGHPTPFTADGSAYAVALYASYQATEKLSLHLRGEYLDERTTLFGEEDRLNKPFKTVSLTTTAQYDLWKNVITRLEFRWDHATNGRWFGGKGNGGSDNEFNSDGTRRNSFMLAANVIYKF